MASELLEESVRMRRAPGIGFADGPSGRRAIVAGSGIDVWEVVATWREIAEDVDALADAYPSLGPLQLRAALGYYTLFPGEIDARLAAEAAWTPERVRDDLPFATPRPGRARS